MNYKRVAQILNKVFTNGAQFDSNAKGIYFTFPDDLRESYYGHILNEDKLPLLITISSWFLKNYDIYFRSGIFSNSGYYNGYFCNVKSQGINISDKLFNTINEALLRAMEQVLINNNKLEPETDPDIIITKVEIPIAKLMKKGKVVKKTCY